MKKNIHPAAFTLIEILVVISIIAILAGIMTPALTTATLNAKIMRAVADARQIGLALRLYANDHGGDFPRDRNDYDEPIVSSNDAFRSLIPSYLDSENVFAIPGSQAGAKADNRISTPSEILARGENHWAYIAGLSSTSNSQWPLIVDHTDGTGFFSNKETEFGGTWRGTKGVVIHTDGSGSAVRLTGVGARRYLPRFDDGKKNALEVKDYMGDGAKLLEPTR